MISMPSKRKKYFLKVNENKYNCMKVNRNYSLHFIAHPASHDTFAEMKEERRDDAKKKKE